MIRAIADNWYCRRAWCATHFQGAQRNLEAVPADILQKLLALQNLPALKRRSGWGAAGREGYD